MAQILRILTNQRTSILSSGSPAFYHSVLCAGRWYPLSGPTVTMATEDKQGRDGEAFEASKAAAHQVDTFLW